MLLNSEIKIAAVRKIARCIVDEGIKCNWDKDVVYCLFNKKIRQYNLTLDYSTCICCIAAAYQLFLEGKYPKEEATEMIESIINFYSSEKFESEVS